MTRYIWGVASVALVVAVTFTAGFVATPDHIATKSPVTGGVLANIAPPPAQPGEETWTFVADLQSPLWSNHDWNPRTAASGEADLQGGIRVDAQFPDPQGLLKTAYTDLSDFLAAGKVPRNGPYVIETAKTDTSTFETYRIEVTSDRCRILAADTEGIRRGIIHVEDMMLRAGGPFLPQGALVRKPFI
jgi:hypothetical protein